jgi:membrane protein required for colicin V production
MTWVDWAIVIVLLAATLGGISQGLLRSVCSLCGLFFGLLLAEWNYARVAAFLMPLVRIEAVADALGFLLIALVVMAVFNLAGGVFSKTIHKMGLGCLDRMAGAVFGFVQGVLLVTISILVIVAFFPQAHWLAEATLPKQFFGALHWSTHVTPGELADRLRHGLDEMQKNVPQWMHPKAGQV